MNDNIRVTVDGEGFPIVSGKVTSSSTPVELPRSTQYWNTTIKRLREPITVRTIVCPEGTVHQPTGPVVEGSVEPLQG